VFVKNKCLINKFLSQEWDGNKIKINTKFYFSNKLKIRKMKHPCTKYQFCTKRDDYKITN